MLFSKRAESITNHLVSGKTRQLLSAPTHAHGWVDPQVFVQRLIDAKSNKVEHDDYDKVLALLRLLPDGREAALKKLDDAVKKRDDYCNAVRYALGGQKVKIGSIAHYWVAAARCRSPFKDDPAVEIVHRRYGPDGGTAASYTLQLEKRPWSDGAIVAICDPPLSKKNIDLALFPTIGLHSRSRESWLSQVEIIPWILTIWPQNLEPAVATALDTFSENIDSTTDHGFRHVLSAMARPGTAIRSVGVAALFTALAMKCPVVHTTATDTVIAAIHDGRLAPEMTAQSIRDLLALNILTLRRWLKPLTIIAEQSDHHAMFVQDLLETIIADIPAKETGGFLELLYETAVALDRPVRSETCRRFLESLTGSGKAAKVAKRLLGV